MSLCTPTDDPPAATPRYFQDIPDELIRMQKYRAKSFQTARIEWSMEDQGVTSYFTSQYAGADFLLVSHGNETGIQNVYSDGKPFAYSEVRQLYKNGAEWRYIEDDSAMFCKDAGSTLPHYDEQTDLRTVGFHAFPRMHGRPELWEADHFLEGVLTERPSGGYRVTQRDDGLIDVEGFFDEGVMAWRLDPKLEFQPTLTQIITPTDTGETRVFQAYTTYDRVDGKLFPKQVEYVSPGDAGSAQREILRVSHAEFDSSDLPSELDIGTSLGLLTGVGVMHVAADGSSVFEIWDGQKAASVAEVKARASAGDFDNAAFLTLMRSTRGDGKVPGSRPKADDSGMFSTPELARSPGLWERFTRQFIAVAYLSPDQTRRAWECLRKYQKPAYKHLEDTKKVRTETERRINELQGQLARAGQVSKQIVAVDAQTKNADELKSLTERRDKLYAPIDLIFEHDFKPGLYSLLTPEQKVSLNKRKSELASLKKAQEK